jgi:hypothetical protein
MMSYRSLPSTCTSRGAHEPRTHHHFLHDTWAQPNTGLTCQTLLTDSGTVARTKQGNDRREEGGAATRPGNAPPTKKPPLLGRCHVGPVYGAPHVSERGGRYRRFGLPNADRSYRVCGAGLASDRAVPYLLRSLSLSPSPLLRACFACLLPSSLCARPTLCRRRGSTEEGYGGDSFVTRYMSLLLCFGGCLVGDFISLIHRWISIRWFSLLSFVRDSCWSYLIQGG